MILLLVGAIVYLAFGGEALAWNIIGYAAFDLFVRFVLVIFKDDRPRWRPK